MASSTNDDEQGGALTRIRYQPASEHLLRGFGPLVVGAILFVLMVLLAPTVAPERIVEEPVNASTTTTVDLKSDLLP